MEYMSMFFSVLFYIAFSIYLFLGIYFIYINPKSNLNRLFLFICISLCIWSFGFSIATSSPTMETALYWRRFSAIGWTSLHALLLHFFLLLTKGDNDIFKKWYSLLPLYIPAIINMYIFSISDDMAKIQYNLVKSNNGWFNISVNNFWDFFFYVYYIGYSVISLMLLWNLKNNAHNKNARKQANIIFNTTWIVFILGSMTDIILNLYLKSPIPQMAPLLIILPVGAIYHSTKYYSMLKEKTDDKSQVILNTSTRQKLDYYVAIAYFVGAVLSFLPFIVPDLLFNKGELESNLYASLTLFLLGLSIMFFRLIKSQEIKDMLISISILLSIPLITLWFLQYAGTTIWVFPIILMILSLILNTRKPLILLTLISITTQIITYIYAPSKTVLINKFDYLLRIAIFAIAFRVGIYVNKIYMSKLRQSNHQAKFQKIISDISFDFVNIKKENIYDKINSILEKTGQFFEVDRSYIFLTNFNDNTVIYSYEWCNGDICPIIENQKFDLNNISTWLNPLKDKKTVYIHNMDQLSKEMQSENSNTIWANSKSVIVLPIEESGEIIGVLGFDTIKSHKKWSDYDIDLLETLANLLANGLTKIENEKEIEFLAYYDYLTGLPNRSLFANKLSEAIERAEKNKKYLAVMFLDLDNFKTVNDTMGHGWGDTVITEVAHSLKNLLKDSDVISRFGGDEFLIMFDNISHIKDINQIADNIMTVFDKPFCLNHQEFFITCSAGISIYPTDGIDNLTLIKNADIAMYQAKAEGKNQYIICTEKMKKEAAYTMLLSNHLHRAEEFDEFIIHYQPQINIDTGEIIGLEALLRWDHPELGIIPPNVFIPIAENNGLINSIGQWVLKSVATQSKKWQDMGLSPLKIAVNLSAVQFNNPNIVQDIKWILKETGLNPMYLELEITESAVTKEINYTINTLQELKKLGISISIDDFGTEYSSLNRLKVLPIDRIKIDMQFVRGIEIDEKDRAIIKVIINLAKNLNMKVLAEGVETKNQLDYLYDKGCHDVQGYYYYKPMPADEIQSLLESINNKK